LWIHHELYVDSAYIDSIAVFFYRFGQN
jgi:hypothetical protein